MNLFQYAIARRYAQLVDQFESSPAFKERDARALERLKAHVELYRVLEAEKERELQRREAS